MDAKESYNFPSFLPLPGDGDTLQSRFMLLISLCRNLNLFVELLGNFSTMRYFYFLIFYSKGNVDNTFVDFCL